MSVDEDNVIHIVTKIEFAAGQWWVNVYRSGALVPMASYGPIDRADFAKQVQREVHNITTDMVSTFITKHLRTVHATIESQVVSRKYEQVIEQNWDLGALKINPVVEVTHRGRVR